MGSIIRKVFLKLPGLKEQNSVLLVEMFFASKNSFKILFDLWDIKISWTN